jgi:YHS domain-containing protein
MGASTAARQIRAPLNPVSGERLRMNEAWAYFHRGQVYCFASEQTRARFAATPHRHAPEVAAGAGASVDTGDPRQSAVRRGVPRHHWPFGDMPAQPQVTDDQLAQIVRYVRELQQANGIVYQEHRM